MATNIFNTIILHEKIDKNRVKNLKGSSSDIVPLDEKKKLDKYTKQYTIEGYRIDYQLPELKNYGRIKEVPYTGLGTFCQEVRGYLADGIYLDVDMVNCHPTIINGLFKKYGIDCSIINEYVSNRDNFLKSEKITKEDFLKIINTGKCDCQGKMKKLHNQIYGVFLAKIISDRPDIKVKKDDYNKQGKIIANFLQDIEFKILSKLYNYCETEGIIIDVLMHDGFFVRITDKVNENVINGYLNKFNEIVNNSFDIDMKFKIKNHNKSLFEKIGKDTRKEYNKLKDEFEKSNCKIFKKGIFLHTNNETITTFTRQSLLTAYENLSFNEGDKRKSFVQEWLKDEEIRQYSDVGCYPKPDDCPDDIFNTWIDFKCEKLKKPNIRNSENIDIILGHLQALSGDDYDVYQWLCRWIGQMIKYPEDKSFCPVFISKQGAGKGTFVSFMQKLLGESKVIESTNPERDVWGQFNGIMETAFLVNINELNKKSTFDAMGRIKGLVTDRKIMINKKGMQSYETNSFHRFVITTNSDDPIETSKDDRRFIIIRCSDKNIGKQDYFKKLNEAIEDIGTIKLCYEYFKNLDGLSTFYTSPTPKTKYQENLIELSLSPVELWLRELSYSIDKEVKMNNKEI